MTFFKQIVSFRTCGIILLVSLATMLPFVYGDECNFGKISSEYRWRPCPSINRTTVEDCIEQNCCYNNTINSQFNCWKKQKSEAGIKNGTCLPYTGSVCADNFNQSMLTNTRRLFDRKYQVNVTDRIMIKLFEIFQKIRIDAKCKNLLESIACPFVMPECTSDDTFFAPCREDCEYLSANCNKGSQTAYALGQIDLILYNEGYDFYHLNPSRIMACDLYQYSYNPGVQCMKLIHGIDRSKPPDDNKIIIIAGAAGGAVFLVFILCLIFCCYRRNERIKKEKLYQTEMEYVSNMTSIREHIRSADSTINPLMELLASSKPGELIQYPVDCIEYVKELGEGQFGKVFQGRVHGVVKGEESTDVAVKCLKEGSSDVAKASFNQEVALMSVLQHNNILRLLAVSTEEEPYCMIFEFMEKGDLNEFLRQWNSKEYLNDSQLIKICKHVAAGMEYLASKKFLHRDLATRNCLVGKDLMVKIADFGMSRNVYHSDYYRVGGEAMLPIRWMPPESILYGKFTVASDVYSFGVVMWEIFSFALQPFYGYGNEEVIEFIKKGVLLPKPEDCPEWIYNIMLNCWKTDVEERITFTRAYQMLKGQFHQDKAEDCTTDNYDRLPSEIRPATEGGNPQSDPSTNHEGYDRVTVSQQPPQRTHNDYDKVWNEPEVKQSTDFNQTPGYINLPNLTKESSKRESSEDLPRSPSTDPGSPNMGFDDDERNLLRPQSTSSLTKGSPSISLKSLTPKALKKNNKTKQQEFQSNEALLQHRRSLQGSRSIKDVMKTDNGGPRYVKSDDVKRISQNSDRQSQHGEGHEDKPEYIGAFRPTSEFLPFHGYGESIQANDPDEAKLIKKIIEESN